MNNIHTRNARALSALGAHLISRDAECSEYRVYTPWGLVTLSLWCDGEITIDTGRVTGRWVRAHNLTMVTL